ncbi:ribonuclease III [Micrococcus sp.]|uniref:ribonuclease III n=1 Tax=Micrococcus sp. TaxID=1271 RepID=UPI002A916F70|nr:ribonuclease III [Micrococcus sp.]MDY6055657.1 ribonuclease III [Micrococcus sp.]
MASPQSRRAPARPEPAELFERLGAHITPGTLELALTHRSFAYEHGGLPTNERLEFLGDSVLGYVVTDHLYAAYPDLPEGDLARRRAAVVSTRALARVARRVGVGEHVRLGTGETRTGGADKDSILADTFEALIGAVYVDHGATAAAALVHRHVVPLLTEPALLRESTDWKTVVAEAAARHGAGPVVYEIEAQGPAHEPRFRATLTVGGRAYGSAVAGSKKQAERDAAAEGWPALEEALAGPGA